MSGSEDTREPGGQAASAAGPAPSAPPSFGGAAPPAGAAPADPPGAPLAEGADAPAPAAPHLPPFGLEAPWWAAESTQGVPEPAPDAAGDTSDSSDSSGSPEAAGEPVTEDESAAEHEPARPADPQDTAGPPPGTLVAGAGIPNIDSRGAVPAEPLVTPGPSTFAETDPDGIPAVRTDEAPSEPRPGTNHAATNGTGTATPPEDGPAPHGSPAAAPAPVPPESNGTASSAHIGTPAPRDVPTPSRPAPSPSTDTAPQSLVPPPARPGDTAGPSAFERAKDAEKVTAAAAPVLEPDAILPRGFRPPSGETGPNEQTSGNGGPDEPVVTPHHEEGVPPTDTPPPPRQPSSGPDEGAAGREAGSGRAGSGKRRLALIGGGAAVVLAAVVSLFVVGGSGSQDDGTTRKAAERPASTPTATGPAAEPAPPPPDPTPLSIDNETTDPKPLTYKEVFPTPAIELGGHAYKLDRRSINRELEYAANGTMLQALQQHRCRKIVRATYVDTVRPIAVTSGIAVMPDKAAAQAVRNAGDPARYQWFRGMSGDHSADIDRAGGYAAATVRGRYVVYAYVQHTDGTPVRPGDPVAKQVAQQFLDHDARPLEQRAKN